MLPNGFDEYDAVEHFNESKRHLADLVLDQGWKGVLEQDRDEQYPKYFASKRADMYLKEGSSNTEEFRSLRTKISLLRLLGQVRGRRY
jgi:hypothetical protein